MTKTIDRTLETAQVFNVLMVIGFLGIVWLMIYGNLSGNLGFTQVSSSFVNQTIQLNDAGSTPAGVDGKQGITLSSVTVQNSTSGEVLEGGNYTIIGGVFTVVTVQYNLTNVNVSYTGTFNSVGKDNTEAVISNLTQGANTFFGFSNTLFTIIAIVLLITLLLGLLAIVVFIMNSVSSKKSSGFSGS